MNIEEVAQDIIDEFNRLRKYGNEQYVTCARLQKENDALRNCLRVLDECAICRHQRQDHVLHPPYLSDCTAFELSGYACECQGFMESENDD